MQDTQRGGGRDRDRPVQDGDGVWQAGDGAHSPPDDAAVLVNRLGTGRTRSDRWYVVRIALSAASEEYALRVVEGLREELDVLGTSLSLEIGPEAPDVFDVLVAMDYEPGTVARALVEPSEIDSVTVCRADGPSAGAGEADDATVSDAIAGVDDGWDEALPADERGPPERGPSVTASGPDESDASGATVSDETFDRLKETTDRVSYDELVADLGETTIPGDFGDNVDLRPIIEDDGTDGGTGGEGNQTVTRDPSTDNSDGGRRLADPAGQGSGLDAERVVEAFVSAVEEDALDDEQRRTIADAFDPGPPKTLLVRLDHLQREMDELSAYKDSLEGFIDEYGAGEGLVQQVREVLEQFTADVADLEAAIATVTGRVDELEDLRSTVRDVGDRLEEHRTRLDDLAALEDRVEALEGLKDRVEALEGLEDQVGTIEEIEDRVSKLESLETRIGELESLGEHVGAVDSSVEALDERLTSVQSELDCIGTVAETGVDGAAEERLDALEAELPELGTRMSVVESETAGTVEDLTDDVASIERRLDDIETWQERITSVLSALRTDAGDDD